MGLVFRSNIASIQAQRQLGRTTEQLSSVYERLASGSRINRASDDAAGLAIASSLRTNAKIYSQGIRNINDGISAVSIADAALDSLLTTTIRLSELSEQAANGSYSLAQRRALNKEADALVKEYNRIVETTSFNGVRLLNSGATTLGIQAGADGTSNSNLALAIGSQLAAQVGSGLFQTGTTSTVGPGAGLESIVHGDFNGDGNIDLFFMLGSNYRTRLGNGDGTFQADIVSASQQGTVGRDAQTGDFNNDGILDMLVRTYEGIGYYNGNGNGTFGPLTTLKTGNEQGMDIRVGDLNNDGNLDFISDEIDAFGNATVHLGNGNGTFSIAMTINGFEVGGFELADFNGDGNLDIIGGDAAILRLGNGNGTFGSPTQISSTTNSKVIGAADFDRDGYADFVAANTSTNTMELYLGRGNGTFDSARSFSDFSQGGVTIRNSSIVDVNGDGYKDVVSFSGGIGRTMISNGDGTFRAALSFTSEDRDGVVTDINNDGVADIVSISNSSNTMRVSLAITESSSRIAFLDILNQDDALGALDRVNQIRDRITRERGAIGSSQSRLLIASNILSIARENYLSAESRITDVDVAQDVAALVTSQIAQQAAIAVLAQANQQPSLVLSLLL